MPSYCTSTGHPGCSSSTAVPAGAVRVILSLLRRSSSPVSGSTIRMLFLTSSTVARKVQSSVRLSAGGSSCEGRSRSHRASMEVNREKGYTRVA